MSANDELQAHTCEKMLRLYENQSKTSKNSILEVKNTSKKISDLTEQWKKGELPYGYYYIKTISGGEVIDRYYRDCTDYDLCEYGDVWENRFEDEIIEVLAPVPSYEEWQPFTDSYFKGLSTKDIAELAKKSIRLTKQHCDDNERIEKLGEENQQLRKWCEEFNTLDVAKENQQLKELLLDCRQTFLKAERNYGFDDSIIDICSPMIEKIDNAIGEK